MLKGWTRVSLARTAALGVLAFAIVTLPASAQGPGKKDGEKDSVKQLEADLAKLQAQIKDVEGKLAKAKDAAKAADKKGEPDRKGGRFGPGGFGKGRFGPGGPGGFPGRPDAKKGEPGKGPDAKKGEPDRKGFPGGPGRFGRGGPGGDRRPDARKGGEPGKGPDAKKGEPERRPETRPERGRQPEAKPDDKTAQIEKRLDALLKEIEDLKKELRRR
jgi:hypothetical protein